MKTYLRILTYVRRYPQYLLGYLVFVLLMAIFSGVSIALIDPVLGLLFLGETDTASTGVNIQLNIHSIKDSAIYLVHDILEAQGKTQALLTFIFIIVGLNLIGNAFRYISNLFAAKLRTRSIYDFRKDVIGSLVSKQLSFLDKQRKGDLITRVTLDVDEVDRSIVSSIQAILKNPFQIALFLTFMLQYSAKLTGIIFIVLPISAIFISFIGKSLKKNARDGQKRQSKMIGVLEESITGMRVVKAFGAEQYIESIFDRHSKAYTRLFNKQLLKTYLSGPFSETSGVIAIGSILWFGGNLVFDGELEATGFMAYIFMFFQTLQPAKELSTSVSRIFKGIASGERIFGLVDEEVFIKDKKDSQELFSFEKVLSFKSVDFAYEKEPILQGVSFDMKKGGFYALVGPSGCGKSTSIELLLRFYDPMNGQISIDGKDIRDYSVTSLRDKMAIVTQEPILFNDTVYNNIAFGKADVTEEEVRDAAKVANAHEFIEALPKGYDTEIGDRGILLSGGQRQRLSIARAVVKKAPILLLDEATSSLDAESEQEVQIALDTVMKSKTSLVVAHRLSTIQHADCIFVMNKGRIEEEGTHSELLEKQGLYWKLSQIQQLNP